jgi:hypothetical protein
MLNFELKFLSDGVKISTIIPEGNQGKLMP